MSHSSKDRVWKWDYDPKTLALSNQVELVHGMDNTDHTSRTLFLSRRHPNLLIVSRGSNDNLDMESADSAQGRAAVKVFDLNAVPNGGYDYASQGVFLAYGARNEVGIAEDPSGQIWGVENSSDDLQRTKGEQVTDIHQDNPGEKLHNCTLPPHRCLLNAHPA